MIGSAATHATVSIGTSAFLAIVEIVALPFRIIDFLLLGPPTVALRFRLSCLYRIILFGRAGAAEVATTGGLVSF